jgi:hypothetical protein
VRSHSPAGCVIGIRADVSETPAIPLSWPALPDIMSETLLSMVFLDEVPEFRRYVLGSLQPPPRLSHALDATGRLDIALAKAHSPRGLTAPQVWPWWRSLKELGQTRRQGDVRSCAIRPGRTTRVWGPGINPGYVCISL